MARSAGVDERRKNDDDAFDCRRLVVERETKITTAVDGTG